MGRTPGVLLLLVLCALSVSADLYSHKVCYVIFI